MPSVEGIGFICIFCQYLMLVSDLCCQPLQFVLSAVVLQSAYDMVMSLSGCLLLCCSKQRFAEFADSQLANLALT